jgi:hypothetical protein
VVHGDPRFGPDGATRTDDVVLRLVQRLGSTELWLEMASEEGGTVWLMVSAESARRLADALADLLRAL